MAAFSRLERARITSLVEDLRPLAGGDACDQLLCLLRPSETLSDSFSSQSASSRPTARLETTSGALVNVDSKTLYEEGKRRHGAEMDRLQAQLAEALSACSQAEAKTARVQANAVSALSRARLPHRAAFDRWAWRAARFDRNRHPSATMREELTVSRAKHHLLSAKTLSTLQRLVIAHWHRVFIGQRRARLANADACVARRCRHSKASAVAMLKSAVSPGKRRGRNSSLAKRFLRGRGLRRWLTVWKYLRQKRRTTARFKLGRETNLQRSVVTQWRSLTQFLMGQRAHAAQLGQLRRLSLCRDVVSHWRGATLRKTLRQTRLAQFLARWQQAKFLSGFRFWRADSVRRGGDKSLVGRLRNKVRPSPLAVRAVFFSFVNITQAAQQRRQRSTHQLHIMATRSPFNFWRCHGATVAHQNLVILRAVGRLKNRSVGAALEGWMEVSQKARNRKSVAIRAVAKLRYREAAACFETWAQVLSAKRAAWDKVGQVIARMKNRPAALALQAWCDLVAAAQERRASACKCLAHLKNRSLSVPFMTWKSATQSARYDLLQMQNTLSAAAFAWWASVAAAARAARAAEEYVVAQATENVINGLSKDKRSLLSKVSRARKALERYFRTRQDRASLDRAITHWAFKTRSRMRERSEQGRVRRSQRWHSRRVVLKGFCAWQRTAVKFKRRRLALTAWYVSRHMTHLRRGFHAVLRTAEWHQKSRSCLQRVFRWVKLRQKRVCFLRLFSFALCAFRAKLDELKITVNTQHLEVARQMLGMNGYIHRLEAEIANLRRVAVPRSNRRNG